MDSAVVLAHVRKQTDTVSALTFHYGQIHGIEVESARLLAQSAEVLRHDEISLDLGRRASSALTGQGEIPKFSSVEEIPPQPDATYVPGRNALFLVHALPLVEEDKITDLFFGATLEDREGFPDCRPEFFEAFELLANRSLKSTTEGSFTLRIHTPLIGMKKSEVLRYGLELGVDFSQTHTCYDPNLRGESCGECGSCRRRLAAFEHLGLRDPIEYSPPSP